MPACSDGPSSKRFRPLALRGGQDLSRLRHCGVSKEMVAARKHAPSGTCVNWGIPFQARKVGIAREGKPPVALRFAPTKARWFVFMHTSDHRPFAADKHGFARASRGVGQLAEHVDLVVNGEVRDGCRVHAQEDAGNFTVTVERSSWIALLVRGRYKDKKEMIAAHSSPVMVEVKGTPFFAAADALTILEQIEGALAFLESVGTRAEIKAYKRMKLVLTAAHRSLHNRMHRAGVYHDHSATQDHGAHH